MAWCSLGGSKALLAICNFLVLVCGFTLITGGMLLLFDTERLLLSKLISNGPLSNLPHPMMYYIALGISALGLILTIAGILGCWAACLHNYCILTFYFFIIIIVLIGECVIFAVIWIYPNCLGLGIDFEELTRNMQRNYGKIDQEQFTAAFDLLQSSFNCCAIESANEYDTSLWRLQSLSHSLAVPLTCCKLRNYNQENNYLNPDPIDNQMCQALETSRHEEYRHVRGCRELLDDWYKQHFIIFLGSGLVLILVEFLVLLSTILTCTRIYEYKKDKRNTADTKEANKTATTSLTTNKPLSFQTASSFPQPAKRQLISAYSNDTYDMNIHPNEEYSDYRSSYKMVDRA